MQAIYKTSLALALTLIGFCSLASAQTKEAAGQLDAEMAKFFEKSHSALDNALAEFDNAQDLPENSELAPFNIWGKSKQSQAKKVEGYLDVAGEALGISSISNRRIKIAELKETIIQKRKNISVYRRKKISAPDSSYNPLVTTKSGYDQKIVSAEEEITVATETITAEKQKLVADLERIGMKLDAKSIDNLLESITGDEFMRVSIIFDNAKKFAAELERLTNESGEDLETAKKYYGVYLMLLKTVSRLQEKFVENVDKEYYPKLDNFADKARENIVDARKAIRLGGDETVLTNNIESNRLTYDAAMFYKQGLAEQKHQMMLANLETKKSILTATNTYKTVALSKDVAELMAVSRRAFNSITGLAVPDLRPFENQKMKKTFSEITRELRK